MSKFSERSKTPCSFTASMHAACSHELFREVWIDAGGEGDVEVLRNEKELRKCCSGIK